MICGGLEKIISQAVFTVNIIVLFHMYLGIVYVIYRFSYLFLKNSSCIFLTIIGNSVGKNEIYDWIFSWYASF